MTVGCHNKLFFNELFFRKVHSLLFIKINIGTIEPVDCSLFMKGVYCHVSYIHAIASCGFYVLLYNKAGGVADRGVSYLMAKPVLC